MSKFRLAFRTTKDEQFIVTAAVHPEQPFGRGSESVCATIFNHEDSFLELVIAADLEESTTREMVVAVILTVARPAVQRPWISVQISEEQNKILGLNLPKATEGKLSPILLIPNRS